jgi:hypothetical protein
MKLEPNNPDNKKVEELIPIKSNELPLKRLKEDIEQHRANIHNPSFCSSIYTFIEHAIRNFL